MSRLIRRMTRHLVLGNTARGTTRLALVLAGLARPRTVGKCIRPSGQVPRLVAALDARLQRRHRLRWKRLRCLSLRRSAAPVNDASIAAAVVARVVLPQLLGARLVVPLSVAPVVVAVIAPVVAVIVPAVVAVAPIVPIVRPV